MTTRYVARFYSSLRRKNICMGACTSLAASGPAYQAEALLDATIASVTIEEGLLLSRSGGVRLGLD